jgi:hypothetical protein
VNTVVAAITNRDIFDHYHITKLFITGHFLRIKEYSKTYQYIIEKKLKNELAELLLHKSYKTTFDISVVTYRHQESKNVSPPKQKHFCHDRLMKGELRAVSSSTYLLRRGLQYPEHVSDLSVGINSSIKFGHSSGFIFRGQELTKRRLKVDVSCVEQEYPVLLSNGFYFGNYINN